MIPNRFILIYDKNYSEIQLKSATKSNRNYTKARFKRRT